MPLPCGERLSTAPSPRELSAPLAAMTEGVLLPSSGLRETPDATSLREGGKSARAVGDARPYGFSLTSLSQREVPQCAHWGGGIDPSVMASRGIGHDSSLFERELRAVGADALIGPQSCDPVQAYRVARTPHLS